MRRDVFTALAFAALVVAGLAAISPRGTSATSELSSADPPIRLAPARMRFLPWDDLLDGQDWERFDDSN